jgi:RNA polymerase sigma-70 factor (ECF subfamily)
MRARHARGGAQPVDLSDPAVLPSRESSGAADPGQALDTLYRAQRPSLLRFFTRSRASPADAEDLTQEAFLRLARAGSAGAAVAQPGAYLRQIGRNLVRDSARASATRLVSIDSDATDTAISEEDELCRLEARDSLRRIEAAMLRLKPRTREIFLAHRLDGMSYAQIAEQTGLSVKGVEKQMTKAIAQIRRAMDRDA